MRHLSRHPETHFLIELQHVLGQDDSHIGANGQLTTETHQAWRHLQDAARQAGFNLCIASGYRSFQRQQAIWNAKMKGERPIFDRQSQAVTVCELTPEEAIYTLLHWSALPGTSRHHWGTDLDVYDPDLLPKGEQLKLQPWEYKTGGYFYSLSCWLSENIGHFNFVYPYNQDTHAVACEPWHISYLPQANDCASLLEKNAIAQIITDNDIVGKETILKHLDDIFARAIVRFIE